jgi:hypothetical protein
VTASGITGQTTAAVQLVAGQFSLQEGVRQFVAQLDEAARSDSSMSFASSTTVAAERAKRLQRDVAAPVQLVSANVVTR